MFGLIAKLRDHVSDLRQLVAQLEVAEPERVLDLVDELQVGRHARSRDRGGTRSARPVAWRLGVAVVFIYCHKTRIQRSRAAVNHTRATQGCHSK